MVEGIFGVGTLAAIADADKEMVGVPDEPDMHIGCAGVFQAVVKTFLDDLEEDDLFAITDGMFGAYRGRGELSAEAWVTRRTSSSTAGGEASDLDGVEAAG